MIAWLLCGICASGKTTLARQIASGGAELLSVDEEMWHRHGSDFTKLPSSRQREMTLTVESEIREQMGRLLKDGKDVVIDSCLCKRFKRDAFRQAALEANAEPRLIYLTADRETLINRLAKRKGANHDDIIVTVEQLDRFLVNFQPPEADEEIFDLN